MARTGPRPNYGKKRRIRSDGYVSLWRPGHPLARSDGYTDEHRLVAWEAGLLTDPALQVHHRNGDKLDNRLENLQVVTVAEHTRLHAAQNPKTHCVQGHEYTDENTRRDRHGWRTCRACNRENQRRRRVAQVTL